MLDLVQGNGSPPTKCKSWSLLYHHISAWSDLQFWRWCNFYILPFFWLEIAYSRPLLGFGGIFPKMTPSIVVTPKRHLLAQKHVVSAIKRENRSNGSNWARAREKTGQDRTVKKSQMRFTYLTTIAAALQQRRGLIMLTCYYPCLLTHLKRLFCFKYET